ncbi:MAG: GAF domain-containing protein, partial [Anaerolineales bacterium]|nr:GAF domain-containing protein [Anaerolineales bacterium]
MTRLPSFFARLLEIGADPADSEAARFDKQLLMASVLVILPAGLLWSGLYLALGAPSAGGLPLLYSVLSGLNLGLFGLTRRFRLFRFAQLLLILLIPWLLMVVLGGFVNSSAVILWGLLAPSGALIFGTPRSAPRWFAAYLALTVLSAWAPSGGSFQNRLPPDMIIVLFVLNVGTPSAIIFFLLRYYVGRLERVNQELTRLASFPELNPAAIIETDLTGRVHYSNPATARLFPEGSAAAGESPLLADLASIAAHLQTEPGHSHLREIKLGDRWYQQVLQLVPGGDRLRSFSIDITNGKRVEEAVRRQNEYLEALHVTTLGLVSRLDLDELLQTILTRASTLLGTGHGFVFLLKPGETEMELKAGVGIFAARLGELIRLGERGVAPQVWATGQPLRVPDYSQWAPLALAAAARAVGSMAAVPLKSGAQTVGVIGLAYDQAGGRSFAEVELEMLDRFAELTALTLDNARLFAQAQDHTRRLGLLNEMGRQMKLVGTLQEIFDVSTRFTPQIVPADHTSIALLTEDQDGIEVLALQCMIGIMPVGTVLAVADTLSGRAVRERRLIAGPHLAE